MTAWVRLALLSILAAAFVALPPGRTALADGPEATARELDILLICPICPGQTIAQSDNEISRQMKAIIRKKLADGETKEQVLAFFVERYGEGVLAAPPREGLNLAVWLAPLAVLVAGAAIVVIAVRRAVRPRGVPGDMAEPPVALSESEARSYRERVARELHSSEGGRPFP